MMVIARKEWFVMKKQKSLDYWQQKQKEIEQPAFGESEPAFGDLEGTDDTALQYELIELSSKIKPGPQPKKWVKQTMIKPEEVDGPINVDETTVAVVTNKQLQNAKSLKVVNPPGFVRKTPQSPYIQFYL